MTFAKPFDDIPLNQPQPFGCHPSPSSSQPLLKPTDSFPFVGAGPPEMHPSTPCVFHHSDSAPVEGLTPEQLKSPVIIEMFCGSARVTAALKKFGVHGAFGVDHHTNHSTSTVRKVDLSCPAGQRLFMQWLNSPLVVGVFIAPPCGACSMARYIKLRDSKGRLIPGPPPLRSSTWPNGLPNLSATNRYRVSQANKLYEFVAKVIRLAASRNLIFAVENPRSSLFWLTSYWINKGVPLQFTAHQACQYGSTRPKWTALAHSHPAFSAINKCCTGETSDHVHEPWGVVRSSQGTHFATSEETSYPLPLASAIASAFVKALVTKGG